MVGVPAGGGPRGLGGPEGTTGGERGVGRGGVTDGLQ